MKTSVGILMLVVAISCVGCSSGYTTENGKVYWQGWNEAVGTYKNPLEDADASTFKVLRHSNYGCDDENCFFRAQLIDGADPETFKTVSQFQAKDQLHAYWREELIVGSDGRTFEFLKSEWGKDAKQCYYGTKPIIGSDPKTFQIVGGYLNSWARDKHAYYYNEGRVPSNDIASLKILDGGFSKDKASVFYQNRVVQGADPATFQMVRGTYIGKDKNGYYQFGQPFQPDPDFIKRHAP